MDSFGENNYYAAYIPKYLSSMFSSSDGIVFRRTISARPTQKAEDLVWIESNSQDADVKVTNEYDPDGNIVGQFLLPSVGLSESQNSTALAWGKVDLTNAFVTPPTQLRNLFFKYHYFVKEIIFPSTVARFGTQSLRWSDQLAFITLPFWSGTEGVTNWENAYQYKYLCTFYVPPEAISWYESQSTYADCVFLPIV
jgi:hypothetical protein